MTAEDLYNALKTTGYPVAYRYFRSAQEPPFLVYYFVESADLMADNVNYLEVGDYQDRKSVV